MEAYTIVRSQKLHHGKVFDLRVDEIEYASGRQAIREVAEHPGGAVIVPLLDDSTLLLVRQKRYPLGEFITELPAGKLQTGEDPASCALRELREETGYDADELLRLGAVYTTPGFCTERLHLFLARGLRRSQAGQQLEEGEESLTVESIPFATAVGMIRAGNIVDAKTICGILMTKEYLESA